MAPRNQIYQFKVTLKGIRPPIWRRVQVLGTSTFWDLHVAIQDAMGWMDCHLHQFAVHHPEWDEEYLVGIPDEWGMMDPGPTAGWKVKVADFLSPKMSALYTYDYGDGWEHKVLLEKIEEKPAKTKFPRCLAGRRACPPEDVGGVYGYAEFLDAIKDPEHDRHDELLEWVGGAFNSEAFDHSKVHFSVRGPDF